MSTRVLNLRRAENIPTFSVFYSSYLLVYYKFRLFVETVEAAADIIFICCHILTANEVGCVGERYVACWEHMLPDFHIGEHELKF